MLLRELPVQVNVQKCEVIVFDRHRGRADMGGDLEVEGVVIPSRSGARCLWFWWRRICLLLGQLRKEAARQGEPFFQFGSVGTFQGVLKPASSKSVIETCVMPVLLFGCILKE